MEISFLPIFELLEGVPSDKKILKVAKERGKCWSECCKILGRRFIFSFTIFSHSEYYIMRLSLYNTSQHRNGDTRLKVRKQQMVVLMEDFSRL